MKSDVSTIAHSPALPKKKRRVQCANHVYTSTLGAFAQQDQTILDTQALLTPPTSESLQLSGDKSDLSTTTGPANQGHLHHFAPASHPFCSSSDEVDITTPTAAARQGNTGCGIQIFHMPPLIDALPQSTSEGCVLLPCENTPQAQKLNRSTPNRSSNLLESDYNTDATGPDNIPAGRENICIGPSETHTTSVTVHTGSVFTISDGTAVRSNEINSGPFDCSPTKLQDLLFQIRGLSDNITEEDDELFSKMAEINADLTGNRTDARSQVQPTGSAVDGLLQCRLRQSIERAQAAEEKLILQHVVRMGALLEVRKTMHNRVARTHSLMASHAYAFGTATGGLKKGTDPDVVKSAEDVCCAYESALQGLISELENDALPAGGSAAKLRSKRSLPSEETFGVIKKKHS